MSHPSTATNRVAPIIERAITKLEGRRSQKEIARRAGMSAIMLSMVRHARNKLPLEHVARLAEALEVDGAWLLRAAFEENLSPRALAGIYRLLGHPMTSNELDILRVVRRASKDKDPAVNAAIDRGLTDLFRTSGEVS